MESNPLDRPELQLVTAHFQAGFERAGQAFFQSQAPTTAAAPIVWAIDAFPVSKIGS